MIKNKIKKLEDAYNKSTQGEWKAGHYDRQEDDYAVFAKDNPTGWNDQDEEMNYVCRMPREQDGLTFNDQDVLPQGDAYSEANADFISLSHNLLPELLEYVKRQDEKIEQLENGLKFYADKENWCNSLFQQGIAGADYYICPTDRDKGTIATNALKGEKICVRKL